MLKELYKNVLLQTPDCTEIPEVSVEEYFDNRLGVVKRGLPFIIRGFLPFNTNVISHLSENFGNELLSARLHTDTQGYAKNRKYQKILLRDYFALIKNTGIATPPYAANNRLGPAMEEALNVGCPLPELKEKFRSPKIWIGAKDTITPLHKDSTDNFACHLFGQKRWILFSVKDIENLKFKQSPYGTYKHSLAGFAVSSIDVLKEELPISIQNNKLEAILNGGDMLYVPFGWGHFVENKSVTIMVNYWLKLDSYKPLILC